MGTRSSAVPMMLFDPYMEVEEFGAELIRTGDLDPVYVMLYRARLPRAGLAKWLLAYWWFYHSGVASMLADQKDFYESARALDKSGPRGVERRHFRGKLSEVSIRWFSKTYPNPEMILDEFEAIRTLPQVSNKLKTWPGFGPWMAFKTADMLERVAGFQIKFEEAELYYSPRCAAHFLSLRRGMEGEDEAIAYLLNWFRSTGAPPSENRPVGIQEVETILCKWGSHREGNYRIGHDTEEIREHLAGCGPLAEQLSRLLP